MGGYNTKDGIDEAEKNYKDNPKQIGRGTYADVYCLEHKYNGTKIVKKDYFLANLGEKTISILNDLTAMGVNIRHKYIVSYYWVKKDHPHLNVFMEYCDGGTLKQFIKQRRNKQEEFDEATIRRYLAHIMSGLNFLHSQNIIHRNIRPSNVLLSADMSTAKLGDFGEGTIVSSEVSMLRTRTGPEFYMAPEMAEEGPYANPVDIWAVGIMAHEMATLCAGPATSPTMCKAFVLFNGRYSAELRDLVGGMLSCVSGERPDCEKILQNPIIAEIL